MQVRDDIEQRTAALLAQGPAYLAQRTLNDFNAEATKQQKAGELTAAVATYNALFAKARHSNVTHPELYVCHSNCAAACLQLGLFTEALQHAGRCQSLAETSLRRWAAAAAGSSMMEFTALFTLRVVAPWVWPTHRLRPSPESSAGTARDHPPTLSRSCARARRCLGWAATGRRQPRWMRVWLMLACGRLVASCAGSAVLPRVELCCSRHGSSACAADPVWDLAGGWAQG